MRAKAHLALDEPLRRRLLEPRVHAADATGARAPAASSPPGDGAARSAATASWCASSRAAGARTLRLVLYYDRVPSLLGLKTILPDVFQRAFRFRRSAQRIVS